MKLYLERRWKKKGYTIGVLYINGKEFCNTLEPEDCGLSQKTSFKSDVALAKVQKGMGRVAIPTGTYRVRMYPSKRFGTMLPHVENVMGFEGILIHAGNTAKDTQGCILVGHLSPALIPNLPQQAGPSSAPAERSDKSITQGEGVIVNSRKTLAALIAEITTAEQRGEPVVLQVV